jgi:uncharacterized Ntn-hydrolase superfamily protein
MTFSLLGADPDTGEVGIVLSSSSPAVAARCAYVRAGVGVAATQNVTDPRLGPALLDALADGASADHALASVRSGAPHAEHRQLAVLDTMGRGAVWSGDRALGVHGERVGVGCAAAGNLLASESVLDALLEGYASAAGSGLVDRLLAGLRAGVDAGGEAGALASAGLLVAQDVPWPVVDLRVDHGEDPVDELCALWTLYAPQREDYVLRALDPDRAPAYGVPGDESVR